MKFKINRNILILNSVILLVVSNLIQCNSAYGDTYETGEEINLADDTSVTEVNSINETSSYKSGIDTDDYGDTEDYSAYYIDSDDNQNDTCSVDYFLNKLYPDDYEEGKKIPVSRRVAHINETISRINRLVNYSSTVFHNFSPLITEMASKVMDGLFSVDLPPECFTSVLRILNSIRLGQPWALKFYDSMGTIYPSGTQEGVLSSFGEFDECLDIESPWEANRETIRGQYCLMKPVLPIPSVGSFKVGENRLNISIEWINEIVQDKYINTFLEGLEFFNRTIYRLGVCIPSTCHQKDIEKAVNQVIFPIARLPYEVGPDCAVKQNKIRLDKYQIISIIFGTALIVLVLMSTIIDLYIRAPKSNSFIINKTLSDETWQQFWTSFSVIKNTSNLFRSDDKRLNSVDTIRLLTIVWIFVMNSYMYTGVIGFPSLKRLFSDGPYKLLVDKKYFFVRNPVLVDTLIMISGLTVALNFAKTPKFKFNYLPFVAFRWIRFTAPLLGSILFVYLCPLFGNGPLWQLSIQILVQPCRENLAPTIFYYNNFYKDVEKICNMPSIYLSTVFQLHLIAPLIVLPLAFLRQPLGLAYNLCWILLGCLLGPMSRLILRIKTPYEMPDMDTFGEMKASVMHYWMGANQHVSTFSLGILLGYLIKRKIWINIGGKIGVIFLSILCPLCSVLAIVWNEQFSYTEKKTSQFHNLIFLAFGKMLWSAGFAWIIYICCMDRGGIVGRFLSHYIFQPFSRLSFGFYLMHSLVILYRLLTVRHSYAMTDWHMFECLIIDFVITNILSYTLYILIECPITNLAKLVRKNCTNKSNTYEPNANDCNNNNNNNDDAVKLEKPNLQNFVYINPGFFGGTADIDNDFKNCNHRNVILKQNHCIK